MTIFEMLEQSGVLTLLGMGIVFGFLALLIVAVSLAGKIIGKIVRTQDGKPASSAVKTGDSGAVTAAIGAAVNQYKQNN